MEESTKMQDEIELMTSQQRELKAEIEQKNILMQQLQRDLDEARSQVTIAQCTAENDVAVEQRKCREEIATVQQLTKEEIESLMEQIHQLQQRLHVSEAERYRIRALYEQQVESVMQTKEAERRDEGLLSPGVISVVTKSIAKHVPSLSPAHVATHGDKGNLLESANTSVTSENLEESMVKAQESASVLKSLVVPLEEEIQALKIKLREQDAELMARQAQEHASLKTSDIMEALFQGHSTTDVARELDAKMQDVEENLQSPETSRGSLELYAAILNTQKASLKDTIERLRENMLEIQKLFENERKEHRELRKTWEKANDQFLESQRMHLADMRKVRSILSAEQSRKLHELQKMDSKDEQTPALPGQKGRSPDLLNSLDLGNSCDSSSGTLIFPDKTGSLDEFRELDSNTTNSSLIDLRSESDQSGSQDGGSDKSLQLNEFQGAVDSKETGQGNSSHRHTHRVITEAQWNKLQDEIRRYQKNVSYPCSSCSTTEPQIKKLEKDLKDSERSRTKYEGAVNRLKNDLSREAAYRKESEAKWKITADQYEREVKSLEQKLSQMTSVHENVVSTNKKAFHMLRKQMESLVHQRATVSNELKRLQSSNDKLVGKHSQHSQEMQNEIINLPDSMEEMQLLLLRYREEVISAKIAKEDIEETLKSELLFLKDQLSGERHERSSLENKLTSEIDQLREKAAIGESLGDQLNAEHQARAEASEKLKLSEQKRQESMHRNQQLIGGLKVQVEDHMNSKAQLQQTIMELRGRVASLQQDLKNNEEVQRDFVRLSQSLQVQLENIRQCDSEVRWQHEEDVDDCNHCKQKFTAVGRRKHHCRHCGRIFCADCVSKVVNSGPHRRPSKVCDVCHTLLVTDATPFFSTEPPNIPS